MALKKSSTVSFDFEAEFTPFQEEVVPVMTDEKPNYLIEEKLENIDDLTTIDAKEPFNQYKVQSRQQAILTYIPAWMQASTIAMTDCAHKRFHKEILDFAEWARVRDYQNHQILFSKLRRVIGGTFPRAEFVLFGSSGAQLAIHGSDIDICVTDNSTKFVDLFNKSYRLLLTVKSFKYVERVVCNVPILKLKDAETGISADICFNRDDGYKGIVSVLQM